MTKNLNGYLAGFAVLLLVLVWTLPTLGLFVSSFRTADQISLSGWWGALSSSQDNLVHRTATADAVQQTADGYQLSGSLFEAGRQGEVQAWGTSSRAIDAYAPGDSAELAAGVTVRVEADGSYVIRSAEPITWTRGQRLFGTVVVPPSLTLKNYQFVLFDEKNVEGMLKGLVGTATVAIPSTIIPIMIAAFAAYALAWMPFPGRALLLSVIVGMLVIPLQLALIPVLQMHNWIGFGKGYVGVWLAHTGFGLPLAIYLLYNYMSQLPGELIQSAKIDGATDFQVFSRIIVPLSFPALASFAIFQFLWTWNDLLVALVFFIDSSGSKTVMTRALIELLGTRGGNWEILATSAFVSMFVPLMVFFALQRYLIRGLLAGSLK